MDWKLITVLLVFAFLLFLLDAAFPTKTPNNLGCIAMCDDDTAPRWECVNDREDEE